MCVDARKSSCRIRALTPTQCHYAQIEKEALAVFVACKKFRHYLHGAKNVVVYCDHKPLETIFNQEMSKCPPRLTRMFLQLKRYDLKVVWKPGKRMFVPDTLSRAHQSTTITEKPIEVEIHEFSKHLPVSPEKYRLLQEKTSQDLVSKVVKILQGKWPARFIDLSSEL